MKNRKFTGRSNELMVENAKKIAATGKTNLVIRVPVIPTFNCTIKEIQDIAVFADSLPGVKKIHLLPYHRLGQDKYEGLGRKYELEDLMPPDNEQMEAKRSSTNGVKVRLSDRRLIKKQQKPHVKF